MCTIKKCVIREISYLRKQTIITGPSPPTGEKMLKMFLRPFIKLNPDLLNWLKQKEGQITKFWIENLQSRNLVQKHRLFKMDPSGKQKLTAQTSFAMFPLFEAAQINTFSCIIDPILESLIRSSVQL